MLNTRATANVKARQCGNAATSAAQVALHCVCGCLPCLLSREHQLTHIHTHIWILCMVLASSVRQWPCSSNIIIINAHAATHFDAIAQRQKGFFHTRLCAMLCSAAAACVYVMHLLCLADWLQHARVCAPHFGVFARTSAHRTPPACRAPLSFDWRLNFKNSRAFDVRAQVEALNLCSLPIFRIFAWKSCTDSRSVGRLLRSGRG